ncbi:MAG: yrrB 5 [Bacteroidetes bacterium]|nr:yrrB 5 [Bacteroidota bacterium]
MIKRKILAVLLLLSVITVKSQNQRAVDSLLNILKNHPADTLEVDALCRLASEYRYNAPDKATEYVNKALEKAEASGFRRGIAKAMHVLGMINMNQANYDKALDYYFRSLKISRELNDKNAISTSNNNIGMVYWNRGKYEKALQYYLTSLKIDEELGNQNGMASSFNNVGLIYWSQGNYDKALENFMQVITINSQLGDKKGMAGAYCNIGGVNYYKGKMDIAIMFFKKALQLYEELNYKPGMSTTCVNISDVLIEEKKYDEALEYSMRSLNIEKEIGNKAQMCYAYMSIAKNYNDRKIYPKALENYQEAIVIAKEISALKQLSESYKAISDVYQQMNDYKQALKFHQEYTSVQDSILNKESSKQIAEMDAKYNNDKKNKEIELLKKEKEIQSITQAAEKSRSTFIRNSLIGGCAFVLLIALLLYNRNQVKQKANLALEAKNQNIFEQKEQIELQNVELGIKNKEITDSIKYAKRLQEAILPPQTLVKRLLPDSFVLYKPKDIVSGDFYYVEEWGDKTFIAAVDCTGHGVPGAFMSIVGYNLLNQALNVYGLAKPFLILNDLNKNISKMLHQSAEDSSVKDGMDICLISIDQKKRLLEYAGAFNPLWIVRDKTLIELKADKFPVGAFLGEDMKSFTHNEFQLQAGDMLYLFTDGYADQFGGHAGKKFKYKQLQSMLVENSVRPVNEQHELFDKTFEDWKGSLEQIDDILLIGIKIS